MSDVVNVSHMIRSENGQVGHLNRQILECFRRNVQNGPVFERDPARHRVPSADFCPKLIRIDDGQTDGRTDNRQTNREFRELPTQ